MDKNMIFQVPLTYIGMVHLWLFVLLGYWEQMIYQHKDRIAFMVHL